ncbi:DUF4347 domain-containing protein, partial [Microcoleus sp. AT10_D2]|uniref:DUF4347 domain-containing protein n=1 Tax=Microcoleus sp. AT10_D2 TaxID=3055286 RepID=UPI002FD669A4
MPNFISSVFSSIAFIDSALPDSQTLHNGIAAGTEVITLDAARDGVEQITEALANRSNIKSIHIISHGRPASLLLGAIDLNLTNLKTYAKQLQRWSRSLGDSGEILLYGCDVAAGEKGANFVQQLSQLTKAKIAASRSPIGSSAKGGDWELDYTTGAVSSGLAIGPTTRATYQFAFGVTLYDGSSNFPAGSPVGIGASGTTQLGYGQVPLPIPIFFPFGGGILATGAFSPNTGINTASVTAANNTTGYAGYTNYRYTPATPTPTPATFTPVSATFPALDRTNGYSVSFRVAVTAENSISNDRAGFSIIAISSDAQNGIELGFTKGNFPPNGGIFAQTGGTPTSAPTFTRGENAPLPFNINTATDYKLVVQGNTYTLFAGPTAIPGLTNQPLRNYTAFNPATSQPRLPYNPYSQPNFLFFGDATDQASAAFTLGTISVNNFPVAVDDGSYSVVHDKVLSVSGAGVLSNDTDANSGDARSAVVVTTASNGTVKLNLTGDFTYTPKAGFVGTDTFTYNVSDGTDSSVQPATVTINVTNNNLPFAVIDNYKTLHGQVLNVAVGEGVLANDIDLDGDLRTATLVTNPKNGTLGFNKDGSFTYTPNPGFFGLDIFTYSVSDGAVTTPAISANINVINNPPNVQIDNYKTLHDQVLNVPVAEGVLANDSDLDKDLLTATKVRNPNNGTLGFNKDGSFTYTPNPGFFGLDIFTYSVSDGAVTTPAISANINVINNPP